MRRILALALMLLAPLPALADDRDTLTAFLEDSLSGAGRQVVVTGFAGALSSRATITELTIADDVGIWLTLRGLSLDWSRSALLSGRVVVSALTAEEIVLARLPEAGPAALPSPEAPGFRLPELPVSIEIGELSAARIELGPTVLGQSVEGRLDAALSLVGGEGRAMLTLERTDAGPEGEVTLTASYANEGRRLIIDLAAREGADGIAASLLDVPGRPAADLTIKGAGPLEDFTADVRLATDGVDRLSGLVALKAGPEGEQGFSADLAGDLAPLFLPQYAEFFGPDVALKAQGARETTGRIRLDTLAVRTRALTVDGTLALAPDGLPESFILQASLAAPDGGPVLLPLSGEPTRVKSATVDLSYDAAAGDGWLGKAALTGLDRADFRAGALTLSGFGRIARGAAGNLFDATLAFVAEGLAPADPDLAVALGPKANGKARLSWEAETGRLDVPQIGLSGEGYAIDGRLSVEGLATGFRTTGRMQATADDLSRYAGLVGRQIGGRGTVVVEGTGSRLGGDFDLVGQAEGEGLRIGQPEVDRLLSGRSRIEASVKRDTAGTALRSLTISAQSLTAHAGGTLATEGSSLSGDLDFRDLGALGPGYRGTLTAKAQFSGTPEDGLITLAGSGVDLGVGQTEADRLLSGRAEVSARLALKDGKVQIEAARIATPQLQLDATGRIAGALREISLTGRLANLALLIPEFPGAVTLSGDAVQDATGYRLMLRGQGPGQIDARVAGRIDAGFGAADLQISGTAQAALANAFIDPRAVSGPLGFDLALKGPMRLSSVSGRVTLSGGRVTDVDAGLAFERIEAVATLARGVAQIGATSQLTTGGRLRVDGTVGLTAPFPADLALQLDNLRLRDPVLYETTASGTLTLKGGLLGGGELAGRISLGDTELRIPATGLAGVGTLPGLIHRNEPVAVRATRGRAGLLATVLDVAKRSGRAIGLDLIIDAPSRVFVRGRGLDAELGGQLRVRGTTQSMTPEGGFQLIRGRLDLLGKRLTLTRATLNLEGKFLPYVDVIASSTNNGITSFVSIEGPATDPTVLFSSSPELPQEEVLAQLLFGRGLQSITPFQAVRLANAVRTLSGRGGEGIVGKLRRGFGLDDLDLSTAGDGSTTLRAGKYISEKLYTDVEVDQSGRSQINLNLDLREGVTVTGRVSADGETGLGVFLERDY